MTGPADGKRDFFVSFNKADRAWATWVAWALEEAGYSVFFQDWDFTGNFVLEMDEALKRSSRMVAVLSPDFLASGFTAPEWAARFAQDPRSSQGLLIPVRVRECELGGLLAQIVYVDLVGADEQAARERLLRRVRGDRGKPLAPPAFPGAVPARQVEQRPPFPPAAGERQRLTVHNLPQPNRGFVGRRVELRRLRTALTRTGRGAITQPQVVTGLGGVGKTQLALAYAYARLDEYDLAWWLRAEEPASLAADYAGMATRLGLDPVADQQALVAAVRAELEGRGHWLLVFDNAADPASLGPYLPRRGPGHVLVTSRERFWRSMAETVELGVLPLEDAVVVLVGSRPDPGLRAEAERLAEELGRLPLALAQARAYLDELAVDIPTYLERLAASSRRVLSRPSENPDYSHTVATTWLVSVEAAERRHPGARLLLELLAFLAPDAIPRRLLASAPDFVPFFPKSLRDLADRDEAIGALHRFSLLAAGPIRLGVHRLVQAVTRDGLGEANARGCAVATMLLVRAALPFPSREYANWSLMDELVPHALAVAGHAERLGVNVAGLKLASSLLNSVGVYHWARANWVEAESALKRALALRRKVFGPEHHEVANSLGNIGTLYMDAGRLAEAEPLLRQALAMGESLFESHHPEMASYLNSLAKLCRDSERYDEAEELFLRAIEAGENSLGPEHPDVATTLCNLAVLYKRTDRSAKAEALVEHALAIMEKRFGPEHPQVANCLSDLGILYISADRHVKAELLLQHSIMILEKTKPLDYYRLEIVLENYACLLDCLGREDEATGFRARAEAIRQQRRPPSAAP